MKQAKLTPNVCYMAGLFSKAPRREKNFVSINTGIEELQQRFAEIAVKDLKIEPSRIVLGRDGSLGIGFYHSRVAKRLNDIISREVYIFRKESELSRNYVAGMFDISGHFTKSSVEIRHVRPDDALMLENLGVHTRGDSITTITRFVSLIKGPSLLLEISMRKGRLQ